MRVFLTALAFFLSFSFFCQKQEQGNITLELEFAPLGSEPLKINSLRQK